MKLDESSDNQTEDRIRLEIITDCILWQWRVEDGEEQCREVWSGAARIIFGMFTFAFQFLIPLSVSGE